MKYLLVLVFYVVATTAHSEPKPVERQEVNILKINRIIAGCDPNTIQQTCHCKANYLRWTPCIHKKLNITDGPEVNSCVSMLDVHNLCAKYEDKDEVRVCPKPNPIIFHVLKLQRDVEKCGPKTIVDTCYCRRNQLYWTKCLYDRLKLDPSHCPRPHTCVSLKELNDLFNFYSNNGRENCPADCSTTKPSTSPE